MGPKVQSIMSRISQAIPPWFRRFLAWDQGAMVGSALTALLGLAFLVMPWFRVITDWSYDLGYLFRPPPDPLEEVAIIYMDEASHYELDMKYDQKWERSIHAAMLRQLTALPVKAIGLDIEFPSSSDGPTEEDRLLVDAARQHGRVVVGSHREVILFKGEPIGAQPVRPFAELEEVTTWGMAEEAGADGSIRQHFRGTAEAPSMAMRLATMTLASPPDPALPRWLNYYGPPGAIPHYSYWEILEHSQDYAAELAERVVFVGAKFGIGFTGGKGTDDYPTPYTRWQGAGRSPGVEVTATAYLNLVRGDWLRRLSPWTEVMILVVMGLAMGYGLHRCRPGPAAAWGAGISLLVAGLSVGAMWASLTWFPWLIVGLVQFPTALVWSALNHTTRLRQEKWTLQQQMALEKVRAEAQGDWAVSARPTITMTPEISPQGQDDRPTIPDHTLIRCFAEGAFGEVWLAKDVIGTYHAVKIIRRHRFANAKPFEREFRGITKFTPISRSHPGFVHILHVGRNDAAGCIYYVMELGDDIASGTKVDPETYAPHTLSADLKKSKRLPLTRCLDIMIQLARALEYLHQQKLIHRDVKPSNIIFVKGIPKFADIGLVTDMATENRDVTSLGTLGYIAPEGPGSAQADVYSLGKVIYQSAFGMHPKSYPELPSDLIKTNKDPAVFTLNRIILKACEQNPAHRYVSAAALLADLEELLLNAAKYRATEPEDSYPPVRPE